MRKKTIEQCFIEKYLEGPKDYCWDWRGALNSKGRANFRGRSAPRFAWRLIFGEIPDGLNVLHTCDNPACVNPWHLFLGTQKDNVHDMIRKGRKKVMRGENHKRSKVNWEQVKQIRETRGKGDLVKNIANRFGISKTQVLRITKGEHWTLPA